MSGSVCNGQLGGICQDCGECQSGGNNLSICCNNFSNMLEFAQSLVSSLGELKTKQDFSVVHFGTDVSIASTLQNANQARKMIKGLAYTGGLTNLAGAINSCQQTLNDSVPDRANLMLILTDGAPSVPEFPSDPALEASNAANNAKDKGTFIIPILIEDLGNQNADEASYLKDEISSDGNVFIADFDGLSSLEDTVFEQVTCQA